ncbi:MAG: sugar ABC transporter permease [Chloroflexi bacterium RBG_16_72_14]|nr:MAG: sugar ABC transporter permease [Chloroflexi bacterium RBG_16_72_14]
MTARAQAIRPRGLTRTEVAQVLLRGTALIALAVMVVVFGALSPTFLQLTNLEILAKQTAINAILAIGMTFVILTGGIDLSVGSIVGLTAMIAGLLINEGLQIGALGVIVYPHTWMVMVIALVAGALVGAINGLIITRFSVAPFIATLGMLYVARGAAGLLNNGNTFPNLVGRPELGNTGFAELGAGELLGVSWAIWIMGALALVAWFVTSLTPFGRAVYAVGGNQRSAELSGIRVDRTKLVVYMISGLCAATVGLIIASQLVAAHPATGEFFELNAIAAVVLGGTSLSGGRGTIVGTMIGAFVIGVLTVGLNQLGVSSFWQLIVKGSVIVLALVLDQLQVRVQRRIALQQQAHADVAPAPAG